jgi:hypothetical protein
VEKDAQGTQVVNGQEQDFAFLGQNWEETIKATGALKDAKFARIDKKNFELIKLLEPQTVS